MAVHWLGDSLPRAHRGLPYCEHCCRAGVGILVWLLLSFSTSGYILFASFCAVQAGFQSRKLTSHQIAFGPEFVLAKTETTIHPKVFCWFSDSLGEIVAAGATLRTWNELKQIDGPSFCKKFIKSWCIHYIVHSHIVLRHWVGLDVLRLPTRV